ncbi:hypothetical protein ACOSP7_012816 [Xanthoceras sorbifolium]
MTTTKFDIEKFDRNMSFTMWQVKMRAILIHNGLHQALLGKDKLPSTMDEAKKQEMDDKALASIQLCLSNEVLREVTQEKTVKDLWDKLESFMAEGASIKSHIDEFSTILMDLENMEISYDDEDQALMLLRSLPPSYKHFRDTLIYSRQTLKLEDVKAALFSKELIDKELGTSRNDSPAEGLLVRGRTPDKSSSSNQRSRSRSKSRHRNLTCNYYKKKGHIKSECFNLKNKQQNKDQKRDKPAEASIVWVYFLKYKNDMFATFKQWKALVEKQTGRKIKRLRTDNGLEFCQGDFNELCNMKALCVTLQSKAHHSRMV